MRYSDNFKNIVIFNFNMEIIVNAENKHSDESVRYSKTHFNSIVTFNFNMEINVNAKKQTSEHEILQDTFK